jgi:hypothetical protein
MEARKLFLIDRRKNDDRNTVSILDAKPVNQTKA